ncbi:MAG: septum formation inhibitor Maf [Proteobacteria bacterium]|nr:MAG: septum formation inhibitor Maf [Pseudomonadota bacterium]
MFVLASTSPYRQQLLKKLGVPFIICSPNIDESFSPGEHPEALVRRLSLQKAQAVATNYPKHLIIGSDQVACSATAGILTKPGSHEKAVEQLKHCSNQTIKFYTGLCLLDTRDGSKQTSVDVFAVTFRPLDDRLIQRYLEREKPYDCAGSFKSEGLGIVLFSGFDGRDPNSLTGLPLMTLTDMLIEKGIHPLLYRPDRKN